MASPEQGAAIRLPPLQGVLFGGADVQQSQGQPIFVVLPGRGRFTLPVWHVPKARLYTTVRERLVLGLLKFAPGPFTPQLVRELEHLESRITAASRVSIQPAEGEHDDLLTARRLACGSPVSTNGRGRVCLNGWAGHVARHHHLRRGHDVACDSIVIVSYLQSE
jgi:hypothetical protein